MLVYADDTVLVAKSNRDLVQSFTAVKEASKNVEIRLGKLS